MVEERAGGRVASEREAALLTPTRKGRETKLELSEIHKLNLILNLLLHSPVLVINIRLFELF